MACDHVLQMHFLQAGALWHLLLFFFEYDYTLEESGVAADENTNEQAVSNRLAKLAVRACARLAGLLEADEAAAENGNNLNLSEAPPIAPKNPVIEESLTSMLTPYIVSRMADNDVEEVCGNIILGSNERVLMKTSRVWYRF